MVRLTFALVAALSLAPIASADPPAIADILTLRDLGGLRGGVAVSPDGRTVAMFERSTLLEEDRYNFRLLIVAADGGGARAIADGGEAILRTSTGRQSGVIDDRTPAWSPDGASLAYIRLLDDHVELWRVRPRGGGARRIIGGDRDVARFAWLNAREIVASLNPPRSQLMDLAARDRRLGFVVDDRFEPRYSLFPYPDLTNGRRNVVVDIATLRMRDATAAEAAALTPSTGFGASGGIVAFDEESDVRVTVSPATPGDQAASPILALFVSRRGAEAARCTLPECSGQLSGAWIDGERVIFLRRDGRARSDSSIYAWDVSADSVTLLRREDEVLLDCQDTETSLVCMHEAPAQPRRLVAISLSTGELTSLYDPNPQWAQLETTRIERLQAPDAYGNMGHAHLVWPYGYRSGERYPMVIVQYRSRGFLRGGVGDEYPIHALAGRGYFVLSVDRTDDAALASQLSPSQRQVRTELDGSELRMKQTQLEALLRRIEEMNIVDPQRIAITGLSDGAETAYLMLTRTNLIAAAVVSSPPVEPSNYWLGSEAFRRTLRADGAGGPWEDTPEPWASWWRDNGVIYSARRIRAPLLMNLADGEALAAFPLAVRLAELNRPIEMYIYPGEYHVKWRPQHQLMAQQRALDWMDFWLQGIERDDPLEPGRLERWRALRARQATAE